MKNILYIILISFFSLTIISCSSDDKEEFSTTTNTDDETAGFTVSSISGNTTEAGGTATFTVKLSSQPTANVTIGVSSSDTTEGTVSPSLLTFTSSNWNANQTVTVTGVNDSLDDGNQSYTVVLAAANSSDSDYSGLNPIDISVNNNDDETTGFTVSSISGNTTEAGGTATFTVKLSSQPTANVTIGVSSSDTTEGTVSPSLLTFTSSNWNANQIVTVAGVDDSVADGNQSYTVVLAAASSSDSGYSGLNPVDVTLSNTDDETAGFTVSSISGNTTEAGGTATFTVKLNSQLTANVTIGVSSSDTTEGTVSPSLLTFTSSNWNANQTVTVTGVNDSLDDSNQSYTVVLAAANSSDSGYSGLNPNDVSVTNTDDETAGFTVSSISGNTTEAGGTATFTVKLSSQPTANVTIGVSSSDTTEGTVSPSLLTFTSSNWNANQTVTMTGVDDSVADGNQGYTVVLAAANSSDSGYSGLNPNDVSVTNTDDETAGFTVSSISGNTTEAGGTATFTVKLSSQPTANVTIGVSSSDTNEGMVSPSSLTFTSSNWNANQTVTVTGVDDSVADGNQSYTVVLAAASSSDSGYSGLNPVDVTLSNTDDETAGFTVSSISGNTTEAGGTATFTVKLSSQPTANVTIGVSSSDTNEGTVSPSSLTFTSSNWNANQTVTVTGVNDSLDDGNQSYTVVLAAANSSDSGYSGLNPVDVTLSNTDDETAGFTVSSINGNTTEAGGTATFTVKLSSQPTANVTIGVSSSDTNEGTVSPSSLTFTSSNWNANQTVTVTGVNDSLDDGNQSYTVVLAAANSSDSGYSGLNPVDVTLSNTDDETAGFTVSSINGNTTEAGGTATFTVKLSSQPTANVTIGVSSSDTNEGTVSSSSLTFTSSNWNANQTVTVTGVNDSLDDGNQSYTVVLAAANSSDSGYSGLNPNDVSVTNTDDETAGFTVSSISGNTTEAGGTATFTVKLSSQPTANVTIGVSSSDTTEGTVSPSSLTFTSSNWNANQTVTMTGVDDSVADGNQSYTIVLAAANSSDSGYSGLNPTDVSVTNTDVTTGLQGGNIQGNALDLTNTTTTLFSYGSGHALSTDGTYLYVCGSPARRYKISDNSYQNLNFNCTYALEPANDYVYYMSSYTAVYKAANNGTGSTTLLTATNDSNGLTVDSASTLYIFDAAAGSSRSIVKINLSTNTKSTLTNLSTDIKLLRGTVVGGQLYTGGNKVYAFDKSNGSKTDLISAGTIEGVCSDGIYIYYPDSTLKKYHINNGTISNVASINGSFRACTTDGTHLYYTSTNGNVYKITGN